MWICEKCKSEVPEGKVFCLVCASKNDRKGRHEYQMEYLRKVNKGEYKLIAHRVPKDNTTHIQMFGGPPLMSYCDKPIEPVQRYKTHIPFDDKKTLAKLCPFCVDKLQETMQEALAQVPAQEETA